MRLASWALLLVACAAGGDATPVDDAPALADVVGVEVRGDARAYTFVVSVRSPDSGCDRFADWWEVVRPDGTLVHRRILLHSHVDEQPFARSSGPVQIEADDEVIVRAHLSPGGYGGGAMRGTASDGFTETALEPGWGAELETTPPQPESCAF